MGINRFYTPYLPEYTSQFVEKDIGPMLDLMELRAKREERAYALKDETDALLQSIDPGYRTKEIAPQVQQHYKSRINEYMQKHQGNMSSVAAIGDLTKIRSEWRSDPNVSLIRQDKAANDYWDRMRSRSDYDIQTDPNVDPETGQPRQLNMNQSFENYNTPIYRADYNEMINKAYGQLEPDISYGNSYIEDIKDEQGNVIAKQIVRPRFSKIADDKLGAVRSNLANYFAEDEGQPAQYFRAKFQGDPTVENIDAYLKGKYEEPYRQTQSVATYSAPFGTDQEEPEQPATQPTYTGLTQRVPLVDPNINKGVNVQEDLISREEKRTANRIANTGEKIDDLWLELASDETGFVPPEKLMGDKKEVYNGEPITPTGKKQTGFLNNTDKMISGIVFNNLDKDYFRTVQEYIGDDGYYNRYKDREDFNEAKNNGEIEGDFYAYNATRKLVEDAIDRYDQAAGFKDSEEEILSTDLTKSQAYNAVLKSNIFDTAENTPFDINGKDPYKRSYTFKSSLPENWDTQQRAWVSKMTKAYLKDASKTIIQPDYQEMTKDDRESAEDAFIGKTTEGKAVIKDGAMTEHLKAARWIPVDIVSDSRLAKQVKKGDIQTLTLDQKRKIIQENQAKNGETTVNINGHFEDKETSFGSGYYSVTIGRDTWMIQGANEMVEEGRLKNNLFSYEFTENVGNGNTFAMDFADPTKFPQIIDRWNREKIEPSQRAIWFQTIRDERDGYVKLLIYNSNPNTVEKPVKGKDYREENLFSLNGPAVDPEDVELKVTGLYFSTLAGRMLEAYNDTKKPEFIEAYQEAVDNFKRVFSVAPELFKQPELAEE